MSPMPEIMSIRNYRISDTDYTNAMQRASADGVELSALIREWVTDYAAGRNRVGPTVPGTVEVSRAELAKLRTLIDRILQ